MSSKSQNLQCCPLSQKLQPLKPGELLASMEVFRMKPISFCSSFPQQAFPTLVCFIWHCCLIPSHTWVSSHQRDCHVIKSRVFDLFCWCPLKYLAHPQLVLGSKVTVSLSQRLACWSAFVNRVLLDTAVSIHLSVGCGYHQATMNTCNRDHVEHKNLKYWLFGLLEKTFADPFLNCLLFFGNS